MAFTTNQLIAGAYYASGVVSREFETVSGTQYADGLQFLNDILTEKRVDEGMIPYETTYFFTGIVGQEKYWIPGLIEIDTAVFYLQDVRYPLTYVKRNQYFGSPRVQNIQTLPYTFYFERGVGGGYLYMYFEPNQDYLFELHGIFQIPTVSLGQDLTASVTIANLGLPTLFGAFRIVDQYGTLNPGQLVVNGFDLAGFYDSVGALVNFINTGVIPGVQASIDPLGEFVLSSSLQPPVSINIRTNGYPPIGTRSKGNVAAVDYQAALNNSVYDDGNQGVGATLTSNVAQILVIDGYTVNLGDKVLLFTQTDKTQNGVYTLTTLGTLTDPWVLTRSTNYDQPVQIQVGDLFKVLNGTIAANITYVQLSNVQLIGTSDITFAIFDTMTFSNFSTIGLPLYEVFNAVGFDEFYITYLRYCLADRICSEYAYDVPVSVSKQLNKYESWIKSKSRLIDLRMTKTSTLNKDGGYSWQWINLGRGFTTPD